MDEDTQRWLRLDIAVATIEQRIEALEDANVPCGPINRIDQVFDDPQAIARQLKITLEHSAAGPLDLVASPIRLSKTPPEYRSAPPLLGEHTEEVLRGELKLGSEEIAALRKTGAV